MTSLFDDEIDKDPKVYDRQYMSDIKTSGSFFLKDEESRSYMTIEMNSKHPKYSEYYIKLKNLLKEMREYRDLLKYSSGV